MIPSPKNKRRFPFLSQIKHAMDTQVVGGGLKAHREGAAATPWLRSQVNLRRPPAPCWPDTALIEQSPHIGLVGFLDFAEVATGAQAGAVTSLGRTG